MDLVNQPDPQQEVLSKFQDFLKQENQKSSQPVTEEQPLSSSRDWLGVGEEPVEETPISTPSPTLQQEVKPVAEGSFYDKMGKYIESQPHLSASFNSWYSENVLGVKQPKAVSVSEPTVDPKIIQEQWNQAYQTDPIGTTVEMFNRLIQNQQKGSNEQFQNQLKPLLGFVAKTARMQFESGLKNDEVYKIVKPLYDNVVNQLTPEQIQSNPDILNVMYNIVVGQAYRDGKISGKASKSSSPPPLNPVPGFTQGPQGKAVSNLTKEEKALLQKYSNDISYDDYVKYGGVE